MFLKCAERFTASFMIRIAWFNADPDPTYPDWDQLLAPSIYY